ncbi:MAG: heme-binding domain-containing protein [Flavobacteriaceae bacterium]
MIRKVLYVLAVVLVLIQFYRPDLNHSSYESAVNEFIQQNNVSSEVESILKTSCFDCHSNHTSYPFYAQVAPISFWINHHVEEGKEHLNFSDWNNYSMKKKLHKLDEIIEEIGEHEMPLGSYTLIHSNAKLKEESSKLLINWSKELQTAYNIK